MARDYGLSRRWVHELIQRYETEGRAGLQPRSRRPQRTTQATPRTVEDQVVALRKRLTEQGLDAGAETIAAYLGRRTPRSQTSSATPQPSVSTIWRILKRRGFISPQPQKRPHTAWIRFRGGATNQRWQADLTHWQLADGTPVEILNIEDDHRPRAGQRDRRGAPRRGPRHRHLGTATRRATTKSMSPSTTAPRSKSTSPRLHPLGKNACRCRTSATSLLTIVW